MSQPAARKAGKAAGNATGGRCRSRSTAPKAAGDAAASQPVRQEHRSKSRNKIPKSVRYDLENALVGLCNVWFEDIKPHLLRNNIKVHVHPSVGAATGPEGDHPAGATSAPPRCRHINPVSTASQCQLCRLLFNAADSIERAVTQAASVAPPGSPAAAFTAPEPAFAGFTVPGFTDPCHNREWGEGKHLRKHRTTRCTKTSTRDKPDPNSPPCNQLNLHLNLTNLKSVRKREKTKDMGSQTEYPAPYSVCARRHRSCARRERPQPFKRSSDTHRKAVIRRNKSTQTELYLYWTRSPSLAFQRRIRSPSPASPRRVRSSSRVRSSAKRPSSTQRKISMSGLNRPELRVSEDFNREEIIEDIAEKRDQNILLYRRPLVEEGSWVADTETVFSIVVQRKKFNKNPTTRKYHTK